MTVLPIATASTAGDVSSPRSVVHAADAGAERLAAFAALVADVQACRLCPRMAGRRRVLGPANGAVGVPVMFVAEAPGRLGGERTGVPLSADQTGRNFTRLLALTGWDRSDVFITNAILCNPRNLAGNNRTPSRAEVDNCCAHLARQIALVDSSLVVALGATALAALDRIEAHGLTLAGAVGRLVAWRGRGLVPLYHPSPRAQLHRPFARQVDDFAALPALLARARHFQVINPIDCRIDSLEH